MKTLLTLVNLLLVAASSFADDAVTPATRVKNVPFELRLTTLRGASLQPSVGVQAASGLQSSAGIRQTIEGGAVSGLSSEEEWRRLFPKKYGER